MKAYTVRDDELHIVRHNSTFFVEISDQRDEPACCVTVYFQNTQSGTQWDGMKHFPLIEHEMLYGGYVPLYAPEVFRTEVYDLLSHLVFQHVLSQMAISPTMAPVLSTPI